MKKIILTLIAGMFLVTSCADKPVQNTSSTSVKQNEISNPEHTLKLDNGRKWIANTETTEGINNMIKLLGTFNDKDNLEAYNRLSEELEFEFSMIFQKCTMTGEAHNQLHNFLVPMKGFFKSLSSSKLVKCQYGYDNLNMHLKEYKKYFKTNI